ncbi:inosine-5-monophosphate dehydrogenase [Roseobacter cerasinus]|uniref:Inosine-5-monophosphate dehydrogenase n=1 Tax=Roseobacter cerasinus TaxID=2602289 RepID=A0A640VQP7_9RHOB|nr:CBS domain-containing protein [Roseobacter cerasinus]GFE49924.1 inosine-5-monophosphate dehydrogenase [Roseobacter cerasinus]
MLVSQILKTKALHDIVTVSPATLVAEAAKMLSEKRIGTVVVSRDGNSADGILSERDIVREIGARGAGCLSRPVEDLMTTKLITCTSNDAADAVLQKMTDGRFRHMPVLEGGKLIGVVSLGDVVKAKLMELSMEKNALEGMIMGH